MNFFIFLLLYMISGTLILIFVNNRSIRVKSYFWGCILFLYLPIEMLYVIIKNNISRRWMNIFNRAFDYIPSEERIKRVEIKLYLDGEIYYDPKSQSILINKKSETLTLVDVKGWGHLKHLFPDEDKATEFQHEIGKFICESIKKNL
jgi:hypothetical protein